MDEILKDQIWADEVDPLPYETDYRVDDYNPYPGPYDPFEPGVTPFHPGYERHVLEDLYTGVM